jgi:hypothetical protein
VIATEPAAMARQQCDVSIHTARMPLGIATTSVTRELASDPLVRADGASNNRAGTTYNRSSIK